MRPEIYSAAATIVAMSTTMTAVSGPQPPEWLLDPTPASAIYEVRRERAVQVPMRDGVQLSTDLYFPIGAEGPLPVVLIRTPYNKDGLAGHPMVSVFASNGFVVAIQDHRGKFESQGEFFAYPDTDRQDGYDTVEWLTRRSWSNGKVGTFGCSYVGEVQYELAAMRHPAHAAAIPQAGAAPYNGGYWWAFGFRNAGAFELAAAFAWNRIAGAQVHYGPPQRVERHDWFSSEVAPYYSTLPALPDIDMMEVLSTLPVVDMMDHVAAPPNEFANWVSHERNDPYWDRQGKVSEEDRFDVPALHVNSWYDPATTSSFDMVGLMKRNSLSRRARENQVLIMSPTSHCRSETATASTYVGDRDLGDARLAYQRLYLNWFEHWLKGAETRIAELPPFILYVMGRNRWRSADQWPLKGTQFHKLHLDSQGDANSPWGSGRLSRDVPEHPGVDRYAYDPMSPTPTLGGSICCTGGTIPEGAIDQRPLEMRHDTLVYSTAPLNQGLEVTGPLSARLYVSSDAADTDFVVKLFDVEPDGTSWIIQEAIVRARYREGYDRQVMMEEGEVYALDFDLGATSNWFAPGHRIRVLVASANFPRWDRNLNTGGRNWDESTAVVASNTVHHSAEYPSHLVLPVVID